ncbi:hypothetical protein SKAU_G00398560 [Synaphobranchus kaupii]|uniref:Uncharacterized protein n=1 Tax=Synaphobranchus kaupii TaxID=118154 RepID=A0A9Q1IC51_SYNKA|nr:hypothetical protein SKAU_G00398560 [Synaphobranchus kaupii]
MNADTMGTRRSVKDSSPKEASVSVGAPDRREVQQPLLSQAAECARANSRRPRPLRGPGGGRAPDQESMAG